MMVFSHISKDLQGHSVSEVAYTVHEEGTIHEVMQEFRRFLLAVGFHHETVTQYIEAE